MVQDLVAIVLDKTNARFLRGKSSDASQLNVTQHLGDQIKIVCHDDSGAIERIKRNLVSAEIKSMEKELKRSIEQYNAMFELGMRVGHNGAPMKIETGENKINI